MPVRLAAENKPPAADAITIEQPLSPLARSEPDPLDSELRAWKQARGFTVPWRQLSLMASLFFGIASLILPKSVNDLVQWPLYALAAASFYAGVRRRRAKAKQI